MNTSIGVFFYENFKKNVNLQVLLRKLETIEYLL